MQAEYKKEWMDTYLWVLPEKQNEDLYAEQMLLHNQGEGRLEFSKQQKDGEEYYCYKVTGKKSLNSIYAMLSIGERQIRNILSQLFQILESGREYLLSEEDFVLAPSYIFAEFPQLELALCYVPGYGIPLKEQLEGLFEYLLNRVNYDDKNAVELLYDCYMFCMKESGGLAQIRARIETESKKKEENKQNVNTIVLEDRELYKAQGRYQTENAEKIPTMQPRKKIQPAQKVQQIQPIEKMQSAQKVKQIQLTEKIQPVQRVKQMQPTEKVQSMPKAQKPDKREQKQKREKKEAITPAIQYQETAEEEKHSSTGSYFTWLSEKLFHRKGKDTEYRMAMPMVAEEREEYRAVSERKAEYQSYDYEDYEEYEEEEEEERTVLLSSKQQEEELFLINGQTGEIIRIDKFPFFIGTAEGYVDFIPKGDGVSRIHCCINKKGSNYYVSDLNSTNGTYLDEREVLPGKEELLSANVQLRITTEIFYIKFPCH